MSGVCIFVSAPFRRQSPVSGGDRRERSGGDPGRGGADCRPEGSRSVRGSGVGCATRAFGLEGVIDLPGWLPCSGTREERCGAASADTDSGSVFLFLRVLVCERQKRECVCVLETQACVLQGQKAFWFLHRHNCHASGKESIRAFEIHTFLSQHWVALQIGDIYDAVHMM